MNVITFVEMFVRLQNLEKQLVYLLDFVIRILRTVF